MRKFYYQDRAYDVPSVEYCGIDTVVEALERNSPCRCSGLLKNQDCKGVMCSDCIFSHYNPEARFEYLKMEGVLRMENNDTMPEIKGGMLLRFGSNNEWILTVNEESGHVLKLDRGVVSISGVLPQFNRSMVKSIFYRTNAILSLSDIRACMTGQIPAYKDIKHWEREEVKEMTMSELEEYFGCKVKIVKDN